MQPTTESNSMHFSVLWPSELQLYLSLDGHLYLSISKIRVTYFVVMTYAHLVWATMQQSTEDPHHSKHCLFLFNLCPISDH
ncbi:MAG: hypothetical protein CMM01_13975 [Rhodopirellula sp.]|nr:hypothetical protein [Rhodopirellula sp.]